MSKKLSMMLLALLLITPVLSVIPMPALAVGTVTSLPLKAKTGVVTRFFLSGSGWNVGGTIYAKTGATQSWLAGTSVTLGGYNYVDSAGSIISGTYIETTQTADFYIMLSQSTDGSTGVASVLITVVATAPTFELSWYDTVGSAPTVYYKDTLEATGGGYTESSSVTIYFDLTVLKTAASTADGVIDDFPVIGEAVIGSHTVWIYDNTQGVAAQYTGTSNGYYSVTVASIVEASLFSIPKTSASSLTLTGHGFTASQVITASSIIVAGITTTHAQVTVASNGAFSVSVTLGAGPGTTGPASVSVAGVTALVGRLYVSDPTVLGDEGLDLSSTTGNVGSSRKIYLYNFPAGASVAITFGSISLSPIAMDANGAGWASFSVPETPGGTYLVKAVTGGLSKTATFTLSPSTRLYDKDGNRLYTYSYYTTTSSVRVLIRGLDANTWYTITEGVSGTPYNIIVEDRTVKIDKGTFGSSLYGPESSYWNKVKSSALGTIDLTYTSGFSSTANPTGTSIYAGDVTVTGASTYYLSIGSTSYSTLMIESTMSVAVGTTPGITLTFANLVPTKRYQVLFNGGVQTLTISGISATYFLGSTTSATWTAPAVAAGVYNLDLVYFGKTDYIERDKIVYSTAGSGATMSLSRTSNGYGYASVYVYGYGFDASESLNVVIAGPGTTATYGGSYAYMTFAPDANGAFILRFSSTAFNLPEGDYLIYADRAAGKPEPSATITVKPTWYDTTTQAYGSSDYKTPRRGIPLAEPGKTATIDVRNLKPNTRYVFLWDGKFKDLDYHRFTTLTDGSATVTGVVIPADLGGKHTVGIALESDPATSISVLDVEFLYVRLIPGFYIAPTTSAYPTQKIDLDWDISDIAVTSANIWEIVVYLNDMPYGGSFGGTAWAKIEGSSITHFLGTISVPNGDADSLVKVTYAYTVYDTSTTPRTTVTSGTATAAYKLVSGAGALIVGTSGDIAYIKTKVDELGVKIVAVNDKTVLIESKIGLLSADLDNINATVLSIKDGVATVKTDVGTLSGKVVSVQGDVATIKTDVGTLKVDLAATKTAATGTKTTVDGLKTTLDTAKSAVEGLSPILYAAVIMALIAAAASVFSVIQITRKIAG